MDEASSGHPRHKEVDFFPLCSTAEYWTPNRASRAPREIHRDKELRYQIKLSFMVEVTGRITTYGER